MLPNERIWILILLLALLPTAFLYPNGPPIEIDQVCETMFPTGHNSLSQNSDPPYMFEVTSRCYSDETGVQGRLKILPSNRNNATNYFEGFFIQMRPADGGDEEAYGMFKPMNDDKGHSAALGCFGRPQSALGHTDKKKFTARSFMWSPAQLNDTQQSMQLVATVVKEKTEFWVGVSSEVIQYDPFCQPVPSNYEDDQCEYVTCSSAAILSSLCSVLLLATLQLM